MNDHSLLWQTGKPSKAGYYLIAILYEGGLGMIGADYWDTEQGWSHTGNIVGFMPLKDVLNHAHIEWPEHLG